MDDDNPVIRFLKNYWWLGAIVILLILILRLCSGDEGTTVPRPKVNEENCCLTVTIQGKHKDEYEIVLRKDGAEYGKSQKKSKVTFCVPDTGTYTVYIRFIGKGNVPKINQTQWPVHFTNPCTPPPMPNILGFSPPDRHKLGKKISVCTVTIIMDTSAGAAPLNEIEFSKDGTNWQDANVFKDMKAGTYTFYARNKRDESLIDEEQWILKPYESCSPPTKEDLNDILEKIADCDDQASDKMKKLLCNNDNLIVKGVANITNMQELVIDACARSKSYKVTHIELNSDGDVLSITVK